VPFCAGDYADAGVIPSNGLRLAREMGTLFYRSRQVRQRTQPAALGALASTVVCGALRVACACAGV